MRAILILLLLAGCTRAITPRAHHHQVPADLQVCPDQVYAPAPPPTPRTVKALVRWAAAVEIARERTSSDLAECSRRLGQLNEWIIQSGDTQ